MPRALATIAVLALLLAACGDDDEAGTSPASTTADAGGEGAEGAALAVTVTEAWVRVASGDLGAAYLTIRNDGGEPVRLTAASTPAAASVEIHETTMADDGTMTMTEQPDGFEIGPGEVLVLEPGGKHLMLLGFAPGDAASVPITLVFEEAELVIEAPIDAEASAAGTDQGSEEHAHGDDLAALLAGLETEALHDLDDALSAGTFDPGTQRTVAEEVLAYVQETDWPVDVDTTDLVAALEELLDAFDAGDAAAATAAAAAVHDTAHALEPAH